MGAGPDEPGLAEEETLVPLLVGDGPEGVLSKGVVLKMEVSEVVRLFLI